jgi:Flp pilus assembly protein TadD
MTPAERLNLGMSHHQAGRLREAESVYRQVLAEQPTNADALQLLGSLAADVGRLDEAADLIAKAIAVNPNVAQYHANLGAILARSQRFDLAIAALRRAVELDPAMTSAWYNLGSAYLAMFEFAQAIPIFQKAISLDPNWPEPHNNLGLALRNEARHAEAAAAFKRALALRPDYASAHWNLSWTLLLFGDYEAGWREYEWRLKCPPVATARNFAQPRWNGDELSGKTILLHAEQGFGDMIQVIRYAPLVARRGGKVIVECRPELVQLFRAVVGVERVVALGEPMPPFDVQCPMMSLPLAFGTTLATIPATVPYLTAPADRIEAWRQRIGDDGRLRIGLVWAGRPAQQYDRRRSSRLDHFAPLAQVKSTRFFSLQKGEAAAQYATPPPAMEITDFSPDLNDFAETAALIANLDLVIGVETAVTHLAGAMGKPVWAILAHVADWRYMLDRADCAWYPTMRLFRQIKPGDWDAVIKEVASALEELPSRARA